MTIPEQLHLNVLAAPLAAVDRRALSQAWYSALYESRRPARLTAKAKAIAPARTAGGAAAAPNPVAPRAVSRPVAANAKYVNSSGIGGARIERRAAPSPLARRIHKTFARHLGASATQRATFRLGKRARVHVVLHASGARLRLVAFCGRRSAESVTQALAQARYALAARGLTLVAAVRTMEAE